MRWLAWSTLTLWGALLFVTNLVLARCATDCNDSGAVLGYFLVALLTPVMIGAAVYLIRGARQPRGRSVLLVTAGSYVALTAWMAGIWF
jgi:hypothetical protein